MAETVEKSDSLWHKARRLSLNIVLMVAVFLSASAFQSRNMLDTGRIAAPDLEAITLEGTEFDLGAVDARPTLVYFFAPWCHYCAFSSDNLVRLRRLRDENDLRIITVALDWQSVAEVHEYAKKHELNIPVLLGDASVSRDWKVYGFPTYYVLDSDQRVVRRDIGYTTQLGMLWRTWNVD
jgi:thiol-disulfide isomerase/thioredoxin